MVRKSRRGGTRAESTKPTANPPAVPYLERTAVFQKTKMCKFHILAACARGSACLFAHDQEELNPLPDLSCTKLCKSLVNHGTCDDPDCKYAHNSNELRTAPANHETPNPIQTPSTEACDTVDGGQSDNSTGARSSADDMTPTPPPPPPPRSQMSSPKPQPRQQSRQQQQQQQQPQQQQQARNAPPQTQTKSASPSQHLPTSPQQHLQQQQQQQRPVDQRRMQKGRRPPQPSSCGDLPEGPPPMDPQYRSHVLHMQTVASIQRLMAQMADVARLQASIAKLQDYSGRSSTQDLSMPHFNYTPDPMDVPTMRRLAAMDPRTPGGQVLYAGDGPQAFPAVSEPIHVDPMHLRHLASSPGSFGPEDIGFLGSANPVVGNTDPLMGPCHNLWAASPLGNPSLHEPAQINSGAAPLTGSKGSSGDEEDEIDAMFGSFAAADETAANSYEARLTPHSIPQDSLCGDFSKAANMEPAHIPAGHLRSIRSGSEGFETVPQTEFFHGSTDDLIVTGFSNDIWWGH
mmetsp:Transcript_69624/g.193765  ORF Transcript_69624/g.193765 Transcript_69624/m.193765 type:complete len:516 (-) Transcript_69624:464-2011(-)